MSNTGKVTEVKDSPTVTNDDPELNTDPLPPVTPMAADKPFIEFTDEDWEQWDTDNPEEHWISYQDASGVHRVPVWYYQTLGL